METCDKCGPAVSAMYIVRLVDGELSFCGHHYNKYAAALDKVAFEVISLATKELVEVE